MDDRIVAIVLGAFFSVLNAIVTVYLVMKTGSMDGIILLLLFLSVFVFMLTKSVKSRAFIYLLAIVTSSTIVVAAYTDGFGAIILSKEPFLTPYPAMIALMCVSSIIGMLMSLYFVDYFVMSTFPWPFSKVISSIIAIFQLKRRVRYLKNPVSTWVWRAYLPVLSLSSVDWASYLK